MNDLFYVALGLLGVLLVLAVVLIIRTGRSTAEEKELVLRLEQVKADLLKNQAAERETLSESVKNNIVQLGGFLRQEQSRQIAESGRYTQEKLGALQQSVGTQMLQLEKRFSGFSQQTDARLETIRDAVEKNLGSIRDDNNKKLDEMRAVVDEKLQKTINERMSESFKLVNERLEQVYKGLGEMQTLAEGVGDLKKVLSNVKTRGILGEIQLGAILEDILTPEQYDKNVATVPGSRNVVEYAVKIPAEDGTYIYLPIDAKFPGDSYAALRDAYDSGTPGEIQQAVRQLTSTIRAEARDIHDKYIAPPYTTDFGILFLPVEGLYAEVVSRGMVEQLQREYRVNIAGPSTMAALLNSLQMSFKTIAIQKRSGEVWNVLGAVKTEFDKFAGALSQTQSRLDFATRELDRLVGVRTRQMQRKLRNIESLTDPEAAAVFPNLPNDGYGAVGDEDEEDSGPDDL